MNYIGEYDSPKKTLKHYDFQICSGIIKRFFIFSFIDLLWTSGIGLMISSEKIHTESENMCIMSVHSDLTEQVFLMEIAAKG